jgi:uncharacterized membrane protein
MLQAVERVRGGVLWANLHLLFWLSLFPFATAWMGENDFAKTPTALYGALSLAAAIAYYVLQLVILRAQGPGSVLEQAIGRDVKGKISPVIYATAIPLAFVSPWISLTLYGVVAAVWLVPDRRVEHQLG